MFRHGCASVHGSRLHYRASGPSGGKGTGPGVPGGPGLDSDSLGPLADPARSGFGAVRYDPLGTGSSEAPTEPSHPSLEHPIEELEAVRRELGLERLHLLGHTFDRLSAPRFGLARPRWVRVRTFGPLHRDSPRPDRAGRLKLPRGATPQKALGEGAEGTARGR